MDKEFQKIIDFIKSRDSGTTTADELAEEYGWTRRYAANMLNKLSKWRLLELDGMVMRIRYYKVREGFE